jgi:hypothetical protein
VDEGFGLNIGFRTSLDKNTLLINFLFQYVIAERSGAPLKDLLELENSFSEFDWQIPGANSPHGQSSHMGHHGFTLVLGYHKGQPPTWSLIPKGLP